MRHGFTATELLVVIAIMVLMVGLAVPSVSESFQRTRVQNAANAIQEAHRQARFLARSSPSGTAHFGVQVTDEYAEVVYGTARWGKLKFPFPKGVVAVTGSAGGDQALNNVSWTYQYGTGYPTDTLTYAAPGQLGQAINIGVEGSPVLTDLRVRTVDSTDTGRHSASVRIFSIGVCHVELQ